MIARVLVSFLLLILTLPIFAAQLIIEPDMGREPILKALNDSKQSIQLVMYGFTDQTLLNALIQKKLAGRTVKVILEETPYMSANENNAAIRELNKAQVNWQGHIPPFRLIHQKTLIVDGKKAIVMTFNFTHSTFKNQRNFALVLDDAKTVKAIESIFSADWNHTPSINSSPDIILSPDDSRTKLIGLIKNAKNSIRIYAQNITDYELVGALAAAAKKDIDVELLTSGSLRKKQSAYLTRAGVHIRYSKPLYIHAKAFIIDNNKAVIGSINLTRSSLDNNRELAVITQDPTLIKQLNNTFVHDWDQSSISTQAANIYPA